MTETDQDTPLGAAFNPVAPEQRIDSLDILRGFALFGVLWMNVPENVGGPIDRIVDHECDPSYPLRNVRLVTRKGHP